MLTKHREGINHLVVLAVNMNISLNDLLADNYSSEMKDIIDTLFEGASHWDFLKRSEANYIKSNYNFVVATRNIKYLKNN